MSLLTKGIPMRFKTRVLGIPATVEVTYYEAPYNGEWGHIDNWEESKPEYIEFDILDGRGRLAPWLEAKMTDEDFQRVQKEALNLMMAEE